MQDDFFNLMGWGTQLHNPLTNPFVLKPAEGRPLPNQTCPGRQGGCGWPVGRVGHQPGKGPVLPEMVSNGA